MKKKLIEVAMPLDSINKASAREKSIRHGHPSTLHPWWSRKPLATARAVLWASLVDDPSSHPDRFPSGEAQTAERERLFQILARLVLWDSEDDFHVVNPEVLKEAKAEILRSTDGTPPAVLDPFAGGGAIPLEAQRLGLNAHAHDLNPVSVMINKALIEAPSEFADRPPVHPGQADLDDGSGWRGASGLAEDVRYYGEWMREEALRRVGKLYPSAKDEEGVERTPIAWLWTRTVKCPNPACGCEMPLANSFALSTRKGHEAQVVLQHDPAQNALEYRVQTGQDGDSSSGVGRVSRGRFRCIVCGEPTSTEYVKSEAMEGRMGQQLMAVVAEGPNGRVYCSPDDVQRASADVMRPCDGPSQSLADDPRHTPGYGLCTFDRLFTNRQLVALNTLSDLVAEVRAKMEKDGASAAYATAVSVYLSFLVDKVADYGSALATWVPSAEKMRGTFARSALAMNWDYAEMNPFSNSSGSISNMLGWIVKSVATLPCGLPGEASQCPAQSDCGLRDVLVSTDPPYYDNIGYADLSDFFYVWLRRNLREEYPDVFQTMLVPKAEELIVAPHRFAGKRSAAKDFFENGMVEACKQIRAYASDEFPVTIYYAYKQKDADAEGTASTGWETMLTAIIRAGFAITATWPMRTERSGRTNALGTNALASSIVLVCRKRPMDAPACTRRDFLHALQRELKPALDILRASNIAPVDMAQSAIGPGMSIYSRYSSVIGADGKPVTVRDALRIINQELDAYFNEQDNELDAESRFCVDLYAQRMFECMPYGQADVLMRAKGTTEDKLVSSGTVVAKKGSVRLLTRDELSKEVNPNKGLWRLTQQMTRSLDKDGVQGTAEIVLACSSQAGRARELAYRLHSIAEQHGWTNEALAYNSLVAAWPEVQEYADKLADTRRGEQGTMFSQKMTKSKKDKRRK